MSWRFLGSTARWLSAVADLTAFARFWGGKARRLSYWRFWAFFFLSSTMGAGMAVFGGCRYEAPRPRSQALAPRPQDATLRSQLPLSEPQGEFRDPKIRLAISTRAFAMSTPTYAISRRAFHASTWSSQSQHQELGPKRGKKHGWYLIFGRAFWDLE